MSEELVCFTKDQVKFLEDKLNEISRLNKLNEESAKKLIEALKWIRDERIAIYEQGSHESYKALVGRIRMKAKEALDDL